MTKHPTKSTALVPTGQRKPPASRRSATSVIAAPTTAVLRPLLGSDLAMRKLVGTGGEIAREEGVVLVTGRAYVTSSGLIPAEEIFYDRDTRPKADGPWLGEADKVSWRDAASGYDCIMLRDRARGYLGGYVGIPSDHPLWGWDSDAVPSDLGIDVHGGLTYSRSCEHGPSPARRLATEARRICHVGERSPSGYEPLRHATDHRVSDENAWWLGFECDHAYDLAPGDPPDLRPSSAEIARTYRDDGYVFLETIALASQLRAVADGGVAPPRCEPPPPVGLDPRRGGGRD